MADQILIEIALKDDKILRSFKDLNKSAEGIQKSFNKISLKNASKESETFSESLLGVKRAAGIAAAALATIGVGKLFSSAIDESIKFQKALISLEALGKAYGIGLDDIRTSVKRLTADGLLPLDAAFNSVRLLLSTGLSLPETEKAIKDVTNVASVLRKEGLTLGRAVETVAEGIKNQNSTLIDNGGVTKNASVIWKEYSKTIGKAVKDLTELEKTQAIVNEITKESSRLGNVAEKIAKTYDGRISKLKSSFLQYKIELGETITQNAEINRLLEALDQVFGTLTKTLSKGILNPFIDSVSKLLLPSLDLALRAVTGLSASLLILHNGFLFIKATIAAVITVLSGLIEILQSGEAFERFKIAGVDAITSLLNLIDNPALKFFNIDVSGAIASLEQIKTTAQKNLDGILQKAPGVAGQIALEANQVINDSLDKIGQNAEIAKNLVNASIDGIIDEKIINVTPNIAGVGASPGTTGGAGSGAAGGISPGGFGDFGDLFPNIRGQITTFFTEFKDAFLNTMSTIISGLSQGGETGARSIVAGIGSAVASYFGGPAAGQAAGELINLLSQDREEMIANISSVFDAIPDVILRIVENLPDLILVLIEKLPEIVPKLIEAWFKFLITVWVKLGQKLAKSIGKAFSNILPSSGDLGKTFSSLGAKITSGLGNLLDPRVIPQKITEGLRKIGIDVSPITDAVNNAFTQLGNGIKNIFNQIFNFLAERFEHIKRVVLIVFEAVSNVFNQIKEVFITVITTISDAFQSIVTFINDNVIEPIKNAFLSIFTFINDNVIEPIKTAFAAIVRFIDTNVIAPIKGLFTTILRFIDDKVIQPIKGAFATITTFISEKVVRPINEVFEKVYTFFRDSVFSPIKNAIDSIGSFFSDTIAKGMELWRQLFTPIQNVFNSIKSAIENLKVPSLTEIFSGFETAVEKMIKGITELPNKIAEEVKRAFDKLNPFKSGSGGGTTGITTGNELLDDLLGVDPKKTLKKVFKLASGGMVVGSGNRDTVPAVLTPGELVIDRTTGPRLNKFLDSFAQNGANTSSDSTDVLITLLGSILAELKKPQTVTSEVTLNNQTLATAILELSRNNARLRA